MCHSNDARPPSPSAPPSDCPTSEVKGYYFHTVAEFGRCRTSVLAESAALDEKRSWLIEGYKSGSHVHVWYRSLASEPRYDLEEDLALLSTQIGRSAPDEEKLPIQYELRLCWRFLVRRYDYCGAFRVGRAMAQCGEEQVWRVWRMTAGYFLPRIFVSILAGFLILLSSSDLIGFLIRLDNSARGEGLLLGSGFLILALALAEVQHRAGRISLGRMAFRLLPLVFFGLVYSGAGSILVYHYGHLLGYYPTMGFSARAGIFALLLGFVFQSFWQEGSLGDPL